MSLTILIFFLVFEITIFLIVFNKDILSPTILFSISFLLSVSFLLMNVNYWGIEISVNTVFIIMCGIFFLMLGEIVSRSFWGRSYLIKSFKHNEDTFDIVLTTSNKTLWTLSFFLLVILIWRFINVCQIVALYGQSGDIFTLLGDYRCIKGIERENIFLTMGVVSSTTIGYFYLFCLIDNYVNKQVGYKKYFIPIFIYLLISILSSGRLLLLYFISVGLVLWIMLYRIHNKWNGIPKNVIRKAIKWIFLCFVAFYFLGMLTGKSQEQESFFQNISIYAGSSIGALDYFLADFKYNIRNFGAETLYGLGNFLDCFGINNQWTGINHHSLEMISLGNKGIRTNIYTCFRGLLYDYGFVGMAIIQFLKGFLYSNAYQRIKYKGKRASKLSIFIYVYTIQFLMLECTSERVLSNILTMTTLVAVFMFILLTKYAAKKIYIEKKGETVGICVDNIRSNGIKKKSLC